MNTYKNRSCHNVLDKNTDCPLKSYIAKNIDSVSILKLVSSSTRKS